MKALQECAIAYRLAAEVGTKLNSILHSKETKVACEHSNPNSQIQLGNTDSTTLDPDLVVNIPQPHSESHTSGDMYPQLDANSAGTHAAFADLADMNGEQCWQDGVVQDQDLMPDMLGDFRGWFSLGSPH